MSDPCPECGCPYDWRAAIGVASAERAQFDQLAKALDRLVDECEQVKERLARLPEDTLPAWMHNIWYEALLQARDTLRQLNGAQ